MKISFRESGLLQAVSQLRLAPQKVFHFLEQPGDAGVLLKRNMVLAR
jgi:hypothetical protein